MCKALWLDDYKIASNLPANCGNAAENDTNRDSCFLCLISTTVQLFCKNCEKYLLSFNQPIRGESNARTQVLLAAEQCRSRRSTRNVYQPYGPFYRNPTA